MAKGAPGNIYHFADQHSIAVVDIVRRICEMMGRPFEECTRVVDERPGQDARYILDYTKAERELGWTPVEPFDAGLREVVEWIDANWEAIGSQSQEYRHVAPTDWSRGG